MNIVAAIGIAKGVYDVAQTIRGRILEDAKNLVDGDRNNQYGPPTQDFDRTAGLLNVLGYRGPNGRLIRASDIAKIQVCVKLSRSMWSDKRDNYVDGAGYFACGYECCEQEQGDDG